MQFLGQLLDYCAATNTTEQAFKYVVKQALRDPVSDWQELIQGQVQSIRDFQMRFMTGIGASKLRRV